MTDPRLFDSRARRLAPRALHFTAAASPWRLAPDVARLALRAAGLEPDERRALADAWDPHELHAGPPDELRFQMPADALRARSPSPLFDLLAATHAAAAAPPARPRVFGILNTTPDSFSDGGRYVAPADAVARGRDLAAAGADVVDVGGESTRPGSEPVPVEVELERVLPVVQELAAQGLEVSVDTRRAAVARAALDAGARWVNDVSAGRDDPEMLPLCAERGCGLVLMHMLGRPRTMQEHPRYDDVVADVLEFLRERVAACLAVGVQLERVVVDPGIGFGKRLEHNLALLRRVGELRSLGLPVLVGASRKSFIAQANRALGAEGPEDRHEPGAAGQGVERLGGSLAALTAAVLGGAELLRVHDVFESAEAARLAALLRDETTPPPPRG